MVVVENFLFQELNPRNRKTASIIIRVLKMVEIGVDVKRTDSSGNALHCNGTDDNVVYDRMLVVGISCCILQCRFCVQFVGLPGVYFQSECKSMGWASYFLDS